MFDSPPEHDAPPGALRVSAPEQVSVAGVGAGLLEVRRLTVGFPTMRGILLAADHVDLALSPSQTLGIVGESGCGKSVTLRAIMDMVPKPGEILSGEVVWRGRSIVGPGASGMESVRGREITMIFQDAGAALNPVYSVGSQLSEVLRVRLGLSRKEAAERAVGLLRSVGIPSPAERARDYPHQLSGGMRQRVMIAMAVAPGPKLLLADEPTTAVDVTVQQQILALLVELQEQTGMAVILVSHDLAVIGETCDTVAVMYAGHVVERGSRDEVIESPRHPYTKALLAAELVFDPEARRSCLETIGGRPPDLGDLPPGCPFQERCPAVRPACRDVSMVLDREWPGHGSACPFVESDR
jgi:oligopeptide/dipeptide ABC transporter ATP-binding protein